MRPHPIGSRIAPFLVLLAIGLVLPGCSGKSSKRALDLYQQGQYPEALREGEQVAQTGKPPESDRAALVAGMSAFELKKYEEAERWLRPASRSSDPLIAGRASATMGFVNVARERYSTAAIDFSSAGRRLQGDEAARAHFFAGECYSILGRLDAAERSYAQARSLAKDTGLRARVGNRQSSTGYTLQLGAFANRANADKTMSLGTQRASRAGLSPPTIVATPDAAGRTIYLVQVGKFTTKEEAAAAKSKLGGDAVVVQMR
jgi:tetratricopeptide (TPR) repeat protein